MTSLEIETTVQADLIALLAGAGVANAHNWSIKRTTSTATGCGVRAIPGLDTLSGGLRPIGMWGVAVVFDCYSYAADDTDDTALRAYAKTVREAIWTDDLIARLNAQSSYGTYYGFETGPSDRRVQGGRRYIELSLSVVMRPSNATTTTTTTTTT